MTAEEIREVKAAALKEFIERLKDHLIIHKQDHARRVVWVEDLEMIAQEIVNGDIQH